MGFFDFLKYDKDGYDSSGYDKFGYDKSGYNRDGYARDGYNRDGYDRDGFDRIGYDKDGLDEHGYDRRGFGKDGYNRDGYNRDGYDKDGFDKNGCDKEGFNRLGYNAEGYNRNGYDREGFDKTGIDKEGFDREGYNTDGYDRDSYNKDGYDRHGYDRHGYDKDGFDICGFNRLGYDREGYDNEGYDKDGVDRSGHSKNSGNGKTRREIGSIKIGLASSEQIRAWSSGEVTKPETINYRTLKPERDGLFCEKIFGPTKDWECHCGKYKRIRYKGKVCERCGVEVTRAKVRRERMGTIELASPVSHIWYYKTIPSRMGLILDLTPRMLEQVLYFEQFIVIDPGNTPLEKKQLLSRFQYEEMKETNGVGFKAGIGAEAIKALLKEIDLDELAAELKSEIDAASGPWQQKIRLVKRLEIVEAFRQSGNRPEWMIMDVIPALPPDLRPMISIGEDRFATSDLNDLYRRVININNRLKKLLDLGAPEIIVQNQKRMLQEAVDALIDNGRRGRAVTSPSNCALKSLSDMLKGKQGRFRQNLLGKRVDYSGRSVIVVDSRLKMYQCGLPKKMALELFKPFVMKRLVEINAASTIKSACRMVERVRPEVWDALGTVIKGRPIFLSVRRDNGTMCVEAFDPVLTEDEAIKVHPVAYKKYALDGGMVAVHVPLSREACEEAYTRMLTTKNLLNPANGKPRTHFGDEIALGCYYLTIVNPCEKGTGKIFSNKDEALLAYNNGVIDLHAPIRVRFIDDEGEGHLVWCTVGFVIFNEAIPQDLGINTSDSVASKVGLDWCFIPVEKDAIEILSNEDIIQKKVNDAVLDKIVYRCVVVHGIDVTAQVVEKISRIGLEYSTKSGISFGLSDLIV